MKFSTSPFFIAAVAAGALLGGHPAAADPPAVTPEQAFEASVERLTIQSLIRKGAWEELYVRSADGLAARPGDPVLLRGKIRALRELGYGAAARKTAQQARAAHPDDPGILLEDVWLTVTAGDWRKVLADTEQAAAKSDADSELILLRGIALRETGDANGAITIFSRLLERNPADCVALTNRGRLYARTGKDDQALVDLTAATACTGEAEPFFARGMLLLRRGKQAEAVADLTKGLTLAPLNISGLLARSEARLMTGDTAGAVQDLKIAQKINPTDPRIEQLSCRLATATGTWTAVTGCAEQSARQNPNDPAAWRTLGKVRLESGNLDGAASAYDTLVKLAPGDLKAHLERATVLLLKSNYAAAVADCSTVIEQQPLSAAYALRSLANYRAGNLAQAEEDATNALVLDRNDQTAILVKANLARARNDLKTALADYERVMQRAPNSPWGATTCGQVQLQAGNMDKAAYYADLARKLAPDDPETTELIAKIAAARSKGTGGAADNHASLPAKETTAPTEEK